MLGGVDTPGILIIKKFITTLLNFVVTFRNQEYRHLFWHNEIVQIGETSSHEIPYVQSVQSRDLGDSTVLSSL